ncbi:MAG TPA: type IV toxin-antitoxin system AbiEi family antitoxin domain-containing protein [Thermoanaerobaculia bacterium]|nr:type IV toxin-antitoxin system AbiEi family antitoxin domain-containing protein [Thermoanaerobaculia bacterium]
MNARPPDPVRYAEPKGIALIGALIEAKRFVFSAADARNASAKVGLAPGAVETTLRRLADAGWVERLRRGLYATTGELPGLAALHPFAIATAIVQPSAVSHWSALNHHGLTTQVPRVVTCMTTRKVVTPSMRSGAGRRGPGRHRWETAGGLRASYSTVTPAHYFGIEDVWIDQRSRVPITDRERTALETFARPGAFGGIGEGLGLLEEHLAELDLGRLVAYALRYGATSVAKRLGFALERAGAPVEALEPLRALPATGVRLLDPASPARGRSVRRWGIQDNLTPNR